MNMHTRTLMYPILLIAAAPALAGGTHADAHGTAALIGQPGKASDVDRTIQVVMTDNAFSITEISVQEDETIRFVVENAGDFLHEFNLGTAEMHASHQEEMMQMMMEMDEMTAAAMAGDHDDPNSILLDPGEDGEIIWTFAKAGELEFACNVPGHYESGMVGEMIVASLTN